MFSLFRFVILIIVAIFQEKYIEIYGYSISQLNIIMIGYLIHLWNIVYLFFYFLSFFKFF